MSSLKYVGTLSSALEYGKAGLIEDWIHEYLLSDGNNKAFSDGLLLIPRFYVGPLELPTALFCRCCGPEDDMRFRVSKAGFERKVASLMATMSVDKDLPPLIANYANGEFVLNDGNHRFEARRRLGLESCFVIIWASSEWEYNEFIEKYRAYVERS